jgi:hypothetical protein
MKVSINTQTCQIIDIIQRRSDGWVEAKVKARLVGGKRWKLRRAWLSPGEFRDSQLGKIL